MCDIRRATRMDWRLVDMSSVGAGNENHIKQRKSHGFRSFARNTSRTMKLVGDLFIKKHLRESVNYPWFSLICLQPCIVSISLLLGIIAISHCSAEVQLVDRTKIRSRLLELNREVGVAEAENHHKKIVPLQNSEVMVEDKQVITIREYCSGAISFPDPLLPESTTIKQVCQWDAAPAEG